MTAMDTKNVYNDRMVYDQYNIIQFNITLLSLYQLEAVYVYLLSLRCEYNAHKT